MTRAVVARVAGATFLLYIAVKVAGSILFEGSIGSGVAASRLAAVAAHASDLRIATVLALANCVCALVMGASLYFYTRSSHAELSTFILICRTGEANRSSPGTTTSAGESATANASLLLELKPMPLCELREQTKRIAGFVMLDDRLHQR